MEYAFILLTIVFLIGAALGLINPKLVFMPGISRFHAFLVCIILVAVSFAAFDVVVDMKRKKVLANELMTKSQAEEDALVELEELSTVVHNEFAHLETKLEMVVPASEKADAATIIPFIIIEKTELGNIKLSIDVQVQLVDGRLPNENELGALSKYLVGKERKHERSFVCFYLPGMKLGHGCFATAHHDPDMKVIVMKYILSQYPEYQKYMR